MLGRGLTAGRRSDRRTAPGPRTTAARLPGRASRGPHPSTTPWCRRVSPGHRSLARQTASGASAAHTPHSSSGCGLGPPEFGQNRHRIGVCLSQPARDDVRLSQVRQPPPPFGRRTGPGSGRTSSPDASHCPTIPAFMPGTLSSVWHRPRQSRRCCGEAARRPARRADPTSPPPARRHGGCGCPQPGTARPARRPRPWGSARKPPTLPVRVSAEAHVCAVNVVVAFAFRVVRTEVSAGDRSGKVPPCRHAHDPEHHVRVGGRHPRQPLRIHHTVGVGRRVPRAIRRRPGSAPVRSRTPRPSPRRRCRRRPTRSGRPPRIPASEALAAVVAGVEHNDGHYRAQACTVRQSSAPSGSAAGVRVRCARARPRRPLDSAMTAN